MPSLQNLMATAEMFYHHGKTSHIYLKITQHDQGRDVRWPRIRLTIFSSAFIAPRSNTPSILKYRKTDFLPTSRSKPRSKPTLLRRVTDNFFPNFMTKPSSLSKESTNSTNTDLEFDEFPCLYCVDNSKRRWLRFRIGNSKDWEEAVRAYTKRHQKSKGIALRKWPIYLIFEKVV